MSMRHPLRFRHVASTFSRAASTARPRKQPPSTPKSNDPSSRSQNQPLPPQPRPPKAPESPPKARSTPETESAAHQRRLGESWQLLQKHKAARQQQQQQQQNQALTPSRVIPGLFLALIAGAMGFYTLNLILAARKPCLNPHIAELPYQKDVAARYDDTADSFDSEVGFSEILMGINSIRKRLARKCVGHVLEVSCGTGRNLGYFDLSRERSQIDSLTFVDLSPAMVEVCRRKWGVLVGEGKKDGAGADASKWKMKQGLVVRFLTGSALGEMPPPPQTTPSRSKMTSQTTESSENQQQQQQHPPKKYDTILQTMGLCSTSFPVPLLHNLASQLNTSNPEARILLLEHGRSYLPWLNNILDSSAEKHAELHGCWFNREIGELVSEAAEAAGLEVVSERRHHLGTTWVFELRAGKEMRRKGGVLRGLSEGGVDAGGDAALREGGGAGLMGWLGWK